MLEFSCERLRTQKPDAKRKRDSAQPQDAKRKRNSAQPQDAKRKRDSAQPQDAKRKRDSAQPQERDAMALLTTNHQSNLQARLEELERRNQLLEAEIERLRVYKDYAYTDALTE